MDEDELFPYDPYAIQRQMEKAIPPMASPTSTSTATNEDIEAQNFARKIRAPLTLANLAKHDVTTLPATLPPASIGGDHLDMDELDDDDEDDIHLLHYFNFVTALRSAAAQTAELFRKNAIPVSTEEVENLKPAEIEIGLVGLDSGTEISLSKDRSERMEAAQPSLLQHSPTYNEGTLKKRAAKLSQSQLFLLAEFEYQLQQAGHRNNDIFELDLMLPIIDPGELLRVCACVCVCVYLRS